MSEMNFLIKPVSGLCNLRCDYCFYADEMNSRKQASYGMMPDKVMEQVIKKRLQRRQKNARFCSRAANLLWSDCPFMKNGCLMKKI